MPRLVRCRTIVLALSSTSVIACITSVSDVPSQVLTNPSDPTQMLATTPSTEAICGTICDALILDYGVPTNLKSACVFECAGGFDKVPEACYELVACVADHSLCDGSDVSVACATKAGDCFAVWSLANGSCRGCWQPSRTVHGKQIVTYLSEGTPATDPRPEDFSNQSIAALLPSTSAEPYRFPGTGNADGTYSIANVPGCGVWIQIGTTYTWAGNSDVDTSYNFPGRRNATIAGPGTTYEVDVQNLVPWTQGDWLEIFTPQLGNEGLGSFLGIDPGAGEVIPPGAMNFLWSNDMAGGALADASQHDVLYVAQLPTKTLMDGTLVRTVERAARVDNFSPMSGVPNPLAVTLTEVSPSRTVHLDFRLSTFHAFAADLHPASTLGLVPGAAPDTIPTTGMVDIWTHPGRPRVGANAELVLVEHPGSKDDVPPLDVSFGTPYRADWGIDLATSTFWTVPLRSRDGKPDYFGFEDIGSTMPLDRHDGAPIVARVSPPQKVRINGLPFSTPQQDHPTLTPRFEWDPPAIGTPTSYQVWVWQLGTVRNHRGVVVAQFVIPTFPGAKEPAIRSFVFPPGVLKAGSDYYFTVSAHDTSNEHDDEGRLVTSEYWP